MVANISIRVTLGVSSLSRFAGIMTIIIIILDRHISNVNTMIVIGIINRNGMMNDRDTVIAIQPMTIGECQSVTPFLSIAKRKRSHLASFKTFAVSMIAIRPIDTKIATIHVDQLPVIMIATIRVRTMSIAVMATIIVIQSTTIR